MLVDVYRSSNHRLKFLVVPAGTDVTGENLSLTDGDFSSIAPVAKGVLLTDKIIGVDPVLAAQDIAAHGYHIGGVKIDIKIFTPGKE